MPPEKPFPDTGARAPILATKLHLPPVRPDLVARPRLLAQLDRGATSRLILVSAPAGFGKTSLVTAWIAHSQTVSPCPAAWIALDDADNDLPHFARYLVAGLRAIAPGAGTAILDWLQAPQSTPMEAALAELLNAVCALDGPVRLVLDDYHVIDRQEVHAAVNFLIEHAPPQFHVMILTRADPPMPLSRWRARGQLAEVRTDDLRFTLEEAAAFLNETMRLGLHAEDVLTLEARTEGWIAGLQLAALSMQGRPPEQSARFIRAFSGSHRFVLDYLIDEVLNRLPGPLQEFLLQTSVLGRLSGPLCDAVTLSAGSQATLEQLERANMFVVPLDDERSWYRTHRLFGDLLRARLQQLQPGLIPSLHARAADWHAAHGWPVEAIHHAFAAQDPGRALELVERSIRSRQLPDEPRLILGWLERVPADMLRDRHFLRLERLNLLAETGALAGLEPLLDDLEADVRRDDGAPEQWQILYGVVRLRILLADFSGDSSRAIRLAGEALLQLPAGAHDERAELIQRLGDAHHSRGEPAQAQQWFERVLRLGREHYLPDRILDATGELAAVQVLAGRLREAERLYLEAQAFALADPEKHRRALGIISARLAGLCLERGDLAAALQHATEGLARMERCAPPNALAAAHVTLARIRWAQGDQPGARAAITQAERLLAAQRYYRRTADVLAALHVRLCLAGGEAGAAAEWLRQRGIGEDDEIVFASELAHLALARVLLALGHAERAARQLDRLAAAAEAAGRRGRLIEILVVQALAVQAAGDVARARGLLVQALERAEPERYQRVFVDEGPALAALLAATRPILQPDGLAQYAAQILAAFGNVAGEPDPAPAAPDALVEPLSPRELEVLRLMAAGLSNAEIAARLFLAEGTVKTHTHSVFGKLGVRSRTQAIRRAQELRLI